MTSRTPKPCLIVVTKNLPPERGGMERLWCQAIQAMPDDVDLVVVGPAKARDYVESYCQFFSVPRFLPLFFLFAFAKTCWISLRKRPQFILAGSGVTAPIVWVSALLTRSKTACYLHGLDIIFPHIIYQTFFLPAIRRMQVVIVNSSNTEKIARKSGVRTKQIFVVNPGVVLPDHDQPHLTGQVAVSPDQRHLVYFGRIVKRKGIVPFLENSFADLVQCEPNIHFHVVGSPPKTSKKHTISELELAKKAVEELGLQEHVTFWGSLSDGDLSALLRQMSVHVFPLIEVESDVEGFGMVALEAAAHGIPTVAFRCGGAADAVGHGVSGYLIENGDYHRFRDAILDCLETSELAESCIAYASQFTWNHFSNSIASLLTATEVEFGQREKQVNIQ